MDQLNAAHTKQNTHTLSTIVYIFIHLLGQGFNYYVYILGPEDSN